MDIDLREGGEAVRMRPELPLLSVIVSSYNNPTGLRRAVASVQGQTYGNIELVVCDDGSTIPAVRDYLDELWAGGRARICRGHREVSEKKGVCSFTEQINAGMDAAAGAYFSYLCDTDVYLPCRCERLVRYLEGHRKVGLVWGMVTNVVDGRKERAPSFAELSHNKIAEYLARRNIINHSSVVHRRTAARWSTDPDSWRFADWLFWKRLLVEGFVFANAPWIGEVDYIDTQKSMGNVLTSGGTIEDLCAIRTRDGT